MDFIKRILIQMHKNQLFDIGAIDVKMNLDSWIPTQEDIDYVIRDMEGLANSQIEDCGEYEWAKETLEQIEKIKTSQDNDERRSLMQDHLIGVFECLPVGLIRKYYSAEYADFIEKALGIEYVVMGGSLDKI